MRIVATQVKAKDLRPGELFSTAPQFYWDNRPPNAVGEKVYIRTEAPPVDEDEDAWVYRITIFQGHTLMRSHSDVDVLF